ncbi:QueT transporter [Melghirimyces profundicolus]|uniref:QueT transporter n=1 Tax=Melghirimyces profundicolus TaxID=1242148 RepID=A0A2T6C7L6_9BACL|nr:QueT transporter family protein [Melghirimyces profundicolus]PTX64319.1 QueT transporter [Melghirimyces profundicolus]
MSAQKIATVAMIAAIYAVLTVLVAPLSHGLVRFGSRKF